MTLMPFVNPDGSPYVPAAYLNSLLCASLYHVDQGPADLYASMSGATLLDWYADPTTYQPDAMIFRQGLEAFTVFGGTTNVPQWVAHYGGSVIPQPDPITKDTIFASVNAGALQALGPIQQSLLPLLQSGGTLRMFGHSYGGGCAFAIATWLLYLTNGQTECMTIGEPKVFGNLVTIKEPKTHSRIIAATPINPSTGLSSFDPVSQLPFPALQYVGFGQIFKFAASIFGFKFRRAGRTFALRPGSIVEFQEDVAWSVPFAADFLVATQLAFGTQLHMVDSSYLPLLRERWLDSGLNPELSAFDSYYNEYTGTPFVPPDNTSNTLTGAQITAALELESTPITQSNAIDWNNVVSVGTIVPGFGNTGGDGSMTLMKGSMLMGIMNQGFSESFHAVNPSTTYTQMATKMQAAMVKRVGLSNGVNDVPPLAPNNQLSVTALRISDELLVRDVYVVPVVTPVGWNGLAGNMDGQQALRVIWRNGSGQQIAATYLHGIPIGGCSAAAGNEARTSPMGGTFTTALQSYCNTLAAQGLGFATINNAPANALGSITGVVYNAVSGNYTVTVTNVVPVGKFRAALRGFKSLNFLNGRQSCQWTGTNSFVVYKRAPAGVWDNSGTAVPLSGYNNNVPFYNYIVQVPSTCVPELICTRKLGRPFFLQRGRISRKAA